MANTNMKTWLALGTALACAGNAGAITLQQAYEAALKNEPAYRASFYEAEAGKENRIIGRSALLPSVAANYSGSRNRAELTVDTVLGENITNPRYISRNATIQLRQPLFNLEAYARYKQSIASSNESAARFVASTSEVTLRVVGAYVDALYALDQLALVKAQRATYTEQMKVNNRLYEKGEGTKTDMLEVQARLDLIEAQLLEAEDNVRNTRQQLEAITGIDVGTLDRLSPDFNFATQKPLSFEDWRATSLHNNPELKAARFSVEVAEQELKRARAGHAPRLDFVASYGRADAETITTVNQSVLSRSLGFQLNIPLYQGGYVNAVSRQAAASLERAKASLDNKTNQVTLELRKAHNLTVTSIAKVGALVKATESGALLAKATEQSIKGGVRINLDLLNAEQQLVSSQRDLAQARYSYLLGILRLRAAAGTLGESDVREIGAYFK